MEIRRGDIVLVDLDPVNGSEQGKTRPAVIIQNDLKNRYAPKTILAPLKRRYKQFYPVNVEMEAEKTVLEEDSVVLLNQVRTISKEHRIVTTIGEVPEGKVEEIDRALEISLGLGKGAVGRKK